MSEEREVFQRVVPVAISQRGDGRTIDARLVPYGVQATVADPPHYQPYTEEFLYGTFDRQAKAPDRIKVWLNFEHQPGLGGIVGHGIALEERTDGLYGSFRVHPGADGDKALALIEEGVLGGMSIEFAALKSRVVDGVVQRVKAMVDKASLTMLGKEAYQGATVLAVREAPEPEPEPAPEPPPEDAARTSEVDEMLARVGFEPISAVTVTRKAWNPSPENYEDADAYARACLIDTNPEGERDVARCWLPVYEPNGDLNAMALEAAAKRINQAPVSARPDAARMLLRLYRTAGLEVPSTLRQLASR